LVIGPPAPWRRGPSQVSLLVLRSYLRVVNEKSGPEK
jgi:hypothetical protein